MACYSYVPLESPGPTRGAEVGLESGDEIRVQVGPVDGRRDPGDPLFSDRGRDPVRTLDGRVLSVEAERIILAVRRPERRGVERFGSRLDTLSVPFERVEQIERRSFSVWQSVAITGATVAGLYFVFSGLLESGGGSGEVGDGLDPT